MRSENMETRYLNMHEIQTRSDDDNNLYVEGYFAVFDEVYNVCQGATESIRKGAFTDSIDNDVRALYNHDTNLVLGRKSAGTLTLEQDDKGLWGRIQINRNDTDAMNAYERIKRGDIRGCSFGFDIESEEEEKREDGTIHWTITKVNPLYEVSPCVFPAYEATSVSARAKQVEQIKKRELDLWKSNMKSKVKGE